MTTEIINDEKCLISGERAQKELNRLLSKEIKDMECNAFEQNADAIHFRVFYKNRSFYIDVGFSQMARCLSLMDFSKIRLLPAAKRIIAEAKMIDSKS